MTPVQAGDPPDLPLMDRTYSRGYGRDPYDDRRRYDDRDRSFLDRAGDEARSWFGDDEARHRRRMDERLDDLGERYERNYRYGDAADERARRAYSSGRYFYEGRDYDHRDYDDRSPDRDEDRRRYARRYDRDGNDDRDETLERRYDRPYNRDYVRDYGDHRGFSGRFEDDGRAYGHQAYGRDYHPDDRTPPSRGYPTYGAGRYGRDFDRDYGSRGRIRRYGRPSDRMY